MIHYPAPLVPGSKIALTAFSSGVPDLIHPRLDRVLADLRQRGFQILEGECLRSNSKHVSASAEARAAEFMRYALDDTIAAIAPPWGGELAIEVLPLLDFDRLRRTRPKWIFGYSDVSTLCAMITAQCGWASLHCANLLELVPSQSDPLTAATLDTMALGPGERFIQQASEHFQDRHTPFGKHPEAPFNLTEKTRWKILRSSDAHAQALEFSGRLMGGCIDTLSHLLNGPLLDLHRFSRQHGEARCLLYLENVELTPAQLARTLLGLKHRGVFEGLAGLLIGRNAGPPVDSAGLRYRDVLESTLGDLGCPVVYDVDIGHKPPNLALINGAMARVKVSAGSAVVEQALD